MSKSISLLTDLYQITMGYGYWKHNMHEQEAVFNLYFRKNPFGGTYSIVAGLQTLIEFINNFHITIDDADYLATLTGSDGKPLFDKDYLTYLVGMEFVGDIDAIPEGTVVFPHEPLIRVKAPLIQAQWLETALLNIINFQTLIATKAHRICEVAKGPVLEFGLRRAQGIDGGLSASRAAYIGGCAGTSNVLAGKEFGIPVKGTHAHSWVMSFDTEKEAFNAYAEAMPNNSIMLVDTYGTISGIKAAIEVGHKLRAQGADLVGIRLDSGDLAELSLQARKMLDDAGFPATKIAASNDLNEKSIAALKKAGAKIDLWGVGTKLATAYDQPALGGVYKLGAIQNENGAWRKKIKLSSTPEKSSNPGAQNVARYYWDNMVDGSRAFADIIFEEGTEPQIPSLIGTVDKDGLRSDMCFEKARVEVLQKKIFQKGRLVYDCPTLEEIRVNCTKSFKSTWITEHKFFVALDENLRQQKEKLAAELNN